MQAFRWPFSEPSLAWAHAEYLKLLRSVKDGEVYDMPPQTVQRYQKQHRSASLEIWTEQAQRTWVTLGEALRMDSINPPPYAGAPTILPN